MKTENIDLIPVRKNNGQFDQWEMSVNGGAKKGAGSYPAIKVAYQDTSNFTFTITDPGSITFTANPIYIQKGTAKPTAGVDSQIKNVKVTNGTVLTFHDTNQTKGTLTYVLNFNNAPQLDPIIENGGGGIGGGGLYENFADNLLWVGLGLIAIGAIAWLAIRAMKARRGPPQGPAQG
jgi:hypothetical protein